MPRLSLKGMIRPFYVRLGGPRFSPELNCPAWFFNAGRVGPELRLIFMGRLDLFMQFRSTRASPDVNGTVWPIYAGWDDFRTLPDLICWSGLFMLDGMAPDPRLTLISRLGFFMLGGTVQCLA